ncbi:hypothetical protein SAMN02799616_03968 [Paenibacillus sp. UNC499MF]|nr:hypothetical protein SAMN02799616_03968 [Paenibacillus sp. UNC499MF]
MQLVLWSPELRTTIRKMKAESLSASQPNSLLERFSLESTNTAQKKPSQPKEYWV